MKKVDEGKIECPNCYGRIIEPKEWIGENGAFKKSKKIIKCPLCCKHWSMDIGSCKDNFGNFMPIMREVLKGPLAQP